MVWPVAAELAPPRPGPFWKRISQHSSRRTVTAPAQRPKALSRHPRPSAAHRPVTRSRRPVSSLLPTTCSLRLHPDRAAPAPAAAESSHARRSALDLAHARSRGFSLAPAPDRPGLPAPTLVRMDPAGGRDTAGLQGEHHPETLRPKPRPHGLPGPPHAVLPMVHRQQDMGRVLPTTPSRPRPEAGRAHPRVRIRLCLKPHHGKRVRPRTSLPATQAVPRPNALARHAAPDKAQASRIEDTASPRLLALHGSRGTRQTGDRPHRSRIATRADPDPPTTVLGRS